MSTIKIINQKSGICANYDDPLAVLMELCRTAWNSNFRYKIARDDIVK